MLNKLSEAISNKKTISITYDGHERILEPHLVGEKTTGNITLSAWQIGGYSESNRIPPWRNYLIDRIQKITVLNELFSGPRPGYNPNDSTMDRILFRL